MDKVLLVGHGSRNKAGNDEIDTFAREWRARNPQWQIEVCFIEFAAVLLDQGLDNAARGATRVIVVPLILNAAGHVKMEIPAHIEEARRRHSKVQFIYAPHLSACEPVLEILKRNLRITMAQQDMPDPRNTGVIILGRGSSDKIANGEIAKIARWLMEETDHDLVDIAFTGITFPRLETAIQRQHQLGMKQIMVLPYYLFTGTLIERIQKQMDRIELQYPDIAFGLSSYFGFEDEIYSLMTQRVSEAMGLNQKIQVMMECDGCKYRELAEEAGHGHHHHHDHAHSDEEEHGHLYDYPHEHSKEVEPA